jgi:rhamnose utilization protein RhaD (predicted bifunctional aldolase and dehydrogenase)
MPNDASLLQAALVGYQNQLEEIDQAMADLRKRIGGGAVEAGPRPAKRRVRRELSAVARKRIADAQKKRWAAYHKQKQGEK